MKLMSTALLLIGGVLSNNSEFALEEPLTIYKDTNSTMLDEATQASDALGTLADSIKKTEEAFKSAEETITSVGAMLVTNPFAAVIGGVATLFKAELANEILDELDAIQNQITYL